MTDDANPPELVWHYTSLGALISILTSNTLMATEVTFQNDPYEERSAHKAMKTLLDSIGDEKDLKGFPRGALSIFEYMQVGDPYDLNADRLLAASRFILCASVNGDSLYAWRTYGSVGSIGCAIGLDRSAPLGIVKSPAPVVTDPWQNVTYSEDALTEELAPRVRQLAEHWKREASSGQDGDPQGVLLDRIGPLWADVRSRAKHTSYKDEEEARVTIVAPRRESVNFCDGRFGPRPHVLLGAADTWGAASPGTERLPIRAVRLGPDAPESAIDSVRWLLAMNDYVIDGELDWGEWEDEWGVRQMGDRLDKSGMVRIERSVHAYRNV